VKRRREAAAGSRREAVAGEASGRTAIAIIRNGRGEVCGGAVGRTAIAINKGGVACDGGSRQSSANSRAGDKRNSRNMNICVIFIDGLGVGRKVPAANPLAIKDLSFLGNFLEDPPGKELKGGGIYFPLDASLGTEGIPQSATGQTALFTGVNAAELLGRHLYGYPNRRLKEVIYQESLLKKLTERGRTAAFINVYRPIFFDLGPEAYDLIDLSVTTHLNLAAGLKFYSLEDLWAERAIYQEFTNEALRRMGFDVPIFSPKKAGEILAGAVSRLDFCLYEYFQTDKAGHSQDMGRCLREIDKLEEFLQGLLSRLDLQTVQVLVVSDHGNIEDMTTRGHTMNPAMALSFGPRSDLVVQRVKSLTDLTPLVLDLL
jgi:hypothetical protein